MEFTEVLSFMALLVGIFVLVLNGNSGALATQGCGILVKNALKSPGYPSNYPNDMDCEYSVPISHGGPLGIYFDDFDLEFESSCRDLSSNKIAVLPKKVFSNLRIIYGFDLSSNMITSLPEKLFANLNSLITLYSVVYLLRDLSSNAIASLRDTVFANLKRLDILYLSSNNISSLRSDVFANLARLTSLDLSSNMICSLPDEVFTGLRILRQLDLSSNMITFLSDKVFANVKYLWYLTLSDNPVEEIESKAFGLSNHEVKMNPLERHDEAITVPSTVSPSVLSFLHKVGFRKTASESNYFIFLPCPLGTFSHHTLFTSELDLEICTDCPPGGFYSDNLAFVAKGCKKCPNGCYIAYEKKPGKSVLDCKTCPLGTKTDFFAGYRACPCLEGHYRTHLFEGCRECGKKDGLVCQREHASLGPGYWWQWRNDSYKRRYQDFIKNLMESKPVLDEHSVKYPYVLPSPYRCQVPESCRGGLDSPCAKGYEGPVCAVCSSGYYKQFHKCRKCPSKSWIVGQLSLVAVVLLIMFSLLARKRKTKLKTDRALDLMDKSLSKLKILIGFYQVTHGLLDLFSYIRWPDSLEVVAKYSGMLQLNLLQIAPFHCLFPGLHMNAFGDLFLILLLNAVAITASGLIYGIRKRIIFGNESLDDEEKAAKTSRMKEIVYKNLFFILYVTYLSSFSKTASVLPLSCRKLCRHKNEKLCNEYLKADYSVKCQGHTYNHLLIVAYISTAYIFALPAASFIVLWRHRRAISTTVNGDGSRVGTETVVGLRFLFENYKPQSWYWELVEMSRRVILTSGLILVGHESRSYIGLAWVVAGMYGIYFSWMKPIQEPFENRLMTTSLAVTVVNLGIGAVSRIPAENISGAVDKHMDAIAMKILILGANTLVIGLLVVQYLVYVYQYFKEWRENPQWSFSCCLAVLLPLNDLHGEIHGMVGRNMLKAQLQTSMIGKPSIAACAKDSGAFSFTLSRGGHRGNDENTTKLRVTDQNLRVKRHRKLRPIMKNDHGTQTEANWPPSPTSRGLLKPTDVSAVVYVFQREIQGGEYSVAQLDGWKIWDE
ncbi:Carboxypeptidase N subunit 2 [Stylophora pistillata]|uniref:Carboxypeptidase N subunit 2 n=1 Tax=Stylophora pistillata TaxID=50429 RepID=A0A2B4RI27_STYPI|nr:Carboxypeptidase N subunit 2 [Stylophora pistillata]